MSYKWCFVPNCPNTVVTTPNKIFFTLPINPERRMKWFNAAGRQYCDKGVLFCCEDHFEITTDMVNWHQYNLMKATAYSPKILKLQPGITPYKFECQRVAEAQRTSINRKPEIEDTPKIIEKDYLPESLNQSPLEDPLPTTDECIKIKTEVNPDIFILTGLDYQEDSSKRHVSSGNDFSDTQSTESVAEREIKEEICHNNLEMRSEEGQDSFHSNEVKTETFEDVSFNEEVTTDVGHINVSSKQLVHSQAIPETPTASEETRLPSELVGGDSVRKNLFSCEFCSYQARTCQNLKKHLYTHREKKPFSCEVCPYTTLHSAALKKHSRKHNGERPFLCELCSYKAKTKATLKGHMRTHTGERSYPCELCSHKATSMVNLKAHTRIHTGEKPFSCNFCPFKTSRGWSLKIHTALHTGEQLFPCPTCSYKAPTKSNLKTHMRIHTGEKPYSCPFCSYKGNTCATLKGHVLKHVEEKPFSCEYCSYKARQRSNLKEHMKTHTGERPFLCDYCSYQARNVTYLKLHIRLHTGEKPYACELCPFKSAAKQYLRKHMLKHNLDKSPGNVSD